MHSNINYIKIIMPLYFTSHFDTCSHVGTLPGTATGTKHVPEWEQSLRNNQFVATKWQL